MTTDKKLRTGNLRGGNMGTRVHPDSAEEQQEKREKAMQMAYGNEDQEMGRATVAPGRSVHCPVPGKKEFFKYDKDGNAVYRPVSRSYGPNEVVTLPLEEIDRLRGLGFLLDPDKKYRTHKDVAATQGRVHDAPHARIIDTDTRPGPTIR